MTVDEPQCLIVEPRPPECHVCLYTVPARLITPEIRKAFEDGYHVFDIDDLAKHPDPANGYVVEECLQPLAGRISFLGLGEAGTLFRLRIEEVIVTQPDTF